MKHSINLPTQETAKLPAEVAKKWTAIFGGLGALGLLGAAAGFASEATREQTLFSYHTAFVFVLSLSLGSLFFTVLQHLVGARWSVAVRRIPETLMSNFGVLALLGIPAVLYGVYGHPHIFHWANLEDVAKDPILTAKQGYLNPTFFSIRLFIYFGMWMAMAGFFYKNSVASDSSGDVSFVQKMRRFSAPSMVLFALSQTFASLDLLMSLDPHWFSTIFGVYFFAGSIVATFSLITMVALLMRSNGLLTDVITHEHYHDLGKLMFGFTVFWTYIGFSQYFLIWYSNIPEETVYFLHRWEGSWQPLSLLLLIGRFVMPFFIIMSKHVKRTLPVLFVMTIWMVGMQYVDIYWMVMPTLHKEGFSFHWLDVSCLLGVVGIWSMFAVRRFASASLVPVQDPYLEKSMEFENV
ncbi:MAG: hypothetical protein ACKO6N_06380 [Myxococcota bacterium]